MDKTMDAWFITKTVALCAFTAYIVSYLKWYKRYKNLPPGPWGLPYFGNLLSMKKNLHDCYKAWAVKYGDIYRLWLAGRLVIVVSGVDMAREVFSRHGELFAGRPPAAYKKKNTEGLIFGEGPVWKFHRKIIPRCLREINSSENTIEQQILDEVDTLVLKIKELEGIPVYPADIISKALANITCSLVFKSRYEYEDPEFLELLGALDKFVHVDVGSPLLVLPDLFPAWKPVINYLAREKIAEFSETINKLNSFAAKHINQQRDTLDVNNKRGILDSYLELKVNGNEDLAEAITDAEIQQVVLDLFLGGVETTTNTLTWGIVFMIRNPDVQAKVQKEIDDVTDGERRPKMSDKTRMPYTTATLLEIQRRANISAVGVPHVATEDVTIAGYDIPKGTRVLYHVHYMLTDPRYWKEPTKFDPRNFLDDDGHVVKRDAMMPFGIGPRICVGESLAKMELFLLFSSLLAEFTFKVRSQDPPPSVEIKRGMNMTPKPSRVLMISRKC